MNQHEAPVGTLAHIGHPANDVRIVKLGTGWVYVLDGKPVADVDFRAGWDDVPDEHGSARLKQAIADRDDATSLLAETRRDLRELGAHDQAALAECDRLGRILELVKDQRDALRVFSYAVAHLEADQGAGVGPERLQDLNNLIAGAHAAHIVQ